MGVSDANRLKQIVAQNKKYKREIKALKRNNPDKGGDNESESEFDPAEQFGGKNSKKS